MKEGSWAIETRVVLESSRMYQLAARPKDAVKHWNSYPEVLSATGGSETCNLIAVAVLGCQ